MACLEMASTAPNIIGVIMPLLQSMM